MPYIVVFFVLGILLLRSSGAIPTDSVGGSMVIALAVFLGALAIGIHDAWTKRRGVLGWIVSIVVAFVGVFVVAPLGGMAMVFLLRPFTDGSSSLAAAGGGVMQAALAGMMIVTLLGSWGALWLANRWR